MRQLHRTEPPAARAFAGSPPEWLRARAARAAVHAALVDDIVYPTEVVGKVRACLARENAAATRGGVRALPPKP